MKRIACAVVLVVGVLGCRQEQDLAYLARGERLLTAIRAGDLAAVDSLLALGAELYLSPDDRALNAAAAQDNLEIFRKVFAADSLVDGYWDHDSPLIAAARHNRTAIARFLVENGADVNYTNRKGESALLHAAFHRDGELARYLLARGADPTVQAADGLTALVGAVEADNEALVETLLEHDVPTETAFSLTSIVPRPPLITAADNGNIGIVRMLLEHAANVKAVTGMGTTALSAAVHNADTAMINLLLAYGAENDVAGFRGPVALDHAINSGQVEIARMLITNGADIDREQLFSDNRMEWAVERNDTAMIALLLELGMDPDGDGGTTPLVKAAMDGSVEAATLLIAHGANIHHRTPWFGAEMSALDFALSNGHFDIADMLLDKGATFGSDSVASVSMLRVLARGNWTMYQRLRGKGVKLPSAPTPDDLRHAFSSCLAENCLECLKVLASLGADVNDPGPFGDPPLTRAAQSCSTDVIAWFLDQGVAIDVRDSDDKTPLMHAAAYGNAPVVSLLLERGADAFAVDEDDRTALSLAGWYGSTDALKILIDHYRTRNRELPATQLNDWLARAYRFDDSTVAEHVAYLRSLGAKATKPAHRSPYLEAASYGGHEALDSLLAAGCPLGDSVVERVFALGCDDADSRTVAWAIEQGFVLPDNAKARFAIEAARADAHEFLDYLLGLGPPLPVRLLRTVVDSSLGDDTDIETVDVLCRHGASLTPQQARIAAGKYGHSWYGDHEYRIALLYEIVRAGIDPAQVVASDTSVVTTVAANSSRLVPILLSGGTQQALNDSLRMAFVRKAIRAKRFDALYHLVRHWEGLPAELCDELLGFAACYNHPDLALLSLARGADIEYKDSDGNTALHWAVLNGNRTVVRLLLAHGATHGRRNEDGRSARDIAVKRGDAAMLALLESGQRTDKDGTR